MKCFSLAILSVFFLVPQLVFASDPYNNSQSYYGTGAGYTGDGLIVAVIDSGIWQEHPDLKGAIWFNGGEIPQNKKDDDGNGYVDDYYGWNFVDNNSDMNPKSNHGTAVAGIIAAQHNGIGVAGYAPGAKIMTLTVCDGDGCDRSNIQEAIKYAVDNGADIINLSLGSVNGYLGYSSTYDKYIKYAYDRGVLIVAAAGNGDVNSSGQTGVDLEFTKYSPVSNDVGGVNMVVGVGATNGTSERVLWSNYGDKYVDVYASGEDVPSTTVPLFSEKYGYDRFAGTSFSAPMVSASAALLMEAYPKLELYEVVDILKINTHPAFNISNLLKNAVNARNCLIYSFREELQNGDSITLKAKSLMPNISASFKNQKEGKTIPLDTAFSVVDADHFEIDTSKLNLPEGEYTVEFKNCKKQYNTVSVKGSARAASQDTTISYEKEDVGQEVLEKKTTSIASEESIENKEVGKYSETANDSLFSMLFLGKEDQDLSEEQLLLEEKLSFSSKFIDFGNTEKIELPLDWALSKLSPASTVVSIVVDLTEDSLPYYEVQVVRKVKFLNVFKLNLDRSVIISATDVNSRPRGESKWYDFLLF